MNDSFFPTADYKVPITSSYMKLVEGKNKFRVLSSAIVGYEYWTEDNKPVRSKTPIDEEPTNIKRDKDGNYNISHFWAFVVWNYDAKRIQILELKQKGVMTYMQGLVNDEMWGNPKGYDIVITRKGSGFDTEYITTANPHRPLDPEIQAKYENTKINLEALFTGADPFSKAS